MGSEAKKVSVCICTYKRPAQLAGLIAKLAAQETPPAIAELVIVDNDPAGSARATVEGAQAPFPLRYDIQPQKNISLTRNRALAMATGEWIGFLDDDEDPLPDWLRRMAQTAQSHNADGVLAPVISQVPDTAPAWIRAGDFFARTRFATGTKVPPNELRIGNAFIRKSWLDPVPGPFDPAYGLTGGEDGNLLNKLVHSGAKLVWCDEAVVTEPVEPARLTRHWLQMRAFRGGQDYARHFLAGAYGPLRGHSVAVFTLRAFVQMAAAAVLTALLLPLGRARWLTAWRKAYANAGKLLVLFGVRYEEYR